MGGLAIPMLPETDRKRHAAIRARRQHLIPEQLADPKYAKDIPSWPAIIQTKRQTIIDHDKVGGMPPSGWSGGTLALVVQQASRQHVGPVWVPVAATTDLVGDLDRVAALIVNPRRRRTPPCTSW